MVFAPYIRIAKINSALSACRIILISIGLPIFVYFLSKAGILTESFMKKYRKHSLVIILILSAIITPPDVTSQILLSLPTYPILQSPTKPTLHSPTNPTLSILSTITVIGLASVQFSK